MHYFKLFFMTCCNSCFHCNVHGSSHYKNAEMKVIDEVFEQIRKIKEQSGEYDVYVQFFCEPTCHPDFITIMEQASQKNLVGENFFQPTNGFGFRKYSLSDIRRLKKTGIDYLQLTFYGLEETHNRMAKNKRAYDSLITTIRKCKEVGLDVFNGLIVHKENLDEFEEARNQLVKAGLEDQPMKWFIYSPEGRGASDRYRLSIDDLKRIGPSEKYLSFFNSEQSFIQKIKEDNALYEQPVINLYGCFVNTNDRDAWGHFNGFSVFRDGKMYFGGYCDSQPPLFFEKKEHYYLGNLLEEDILSIVERFTNHPPDIVKRLQNVTWGELLERYGDAGNDHVYEMNSLVRQKWAALYLSDLINT